MTARILRQCLMTLTAVIWTAAAHAQTPEVIFSDDFSGDLSKWTTIGSSQIIDGKLSVPVSTDMIRALPGAATWSNYRFSAKITIQAVACGLVFRSPDTANGYMWQLSASTGRLRLHKKGGGTYSVLKEVTYPFVTGAEYEVVIEANGSEISTTVNGSLIDTFTDSTFTSGVIGFRHGSSERSFIDDVVVTRLLPSVIPAPGVPVFTQASTRWLNGRPLVHLEWAAGGGAVRSFRLERRLASGDDWKILTTLGGGLDFFEDFWISPAADYEYRLSASNESGASDFTCISVSAGSILPQGYVDWAQSLAPAPPGSLGSGMRWEDHGEDGLANSFRYAFSGNPQRPGGPGALSFRPGTPGGCDLWARTFTARGDVRYYLSVSPDLVSWQTFMDEMGSQFPFAASGPGSSYLLLTTRQATNSNFFARWAIEPKTNISLPPSGLLLNQLPASSEAFLTQGTPRFGWVVGNSNQTAYEILVATSPDLLSSGQADVWSSGMITSGDSLNIPFGGRPLVSNSTYYWTVRTWNAGGEASPYAAPATLRTGELSPHYRTDRPLLVQTPVAPVRIVKKGEGWYFIDFGRAAFGTVTLEIPNPADGQPFTVALGEKATPADAVNTSPGNTVRYQQRTLTMVSGVQSYRVVPTWSPVSGGFVSMPDYIGQVTPFRYAEIRDVPEPFAPENVRQLSTHVPFDDSAASFTSSDGILNQVWELCKYSIKATTFIGVYVDGDRERIAYEGDIYINQLGHYAVDRDYATARYSLEHVLVHSTWPTEWLMHCVLIAYMDYLYTGDTRSLAANYPVLKARTLLSRARPDGLINGTTGSGGGTQPTDIVDWPAGERDGYDMGRVVKTVVSSFHYQTLVYMNEIATVLGNHADAADFAQRAALTKDSINFLLWDSDNNRYIDGMNAAGVPSTHAALHANMFPLAFGIVPEERRAAVTSYIKSRGMACSVYGAQFLLDGLYGAGEADHALSLLTATGLRSWMNMINLGSTITLEAWDPSFKPNLDWNHAWGAAPANIIPRWLMGIRPIEPGFRKFVVQPQPGSLSHASIKVPTVRGSITVNVNHNSSSVFSLTVDVPPNTKAKIGVPTLGGGSDTVLMNGEEISASREGNTLWIDHVPPGNHLFVREP